MSSTRVTQNELANLLGINANAIRKKVANGTLELDDDGMLDMDASIAKLQADPAFGSRPQRVEREPTPLMRQITQQPLDEDTDTDSLMNDSADGMSGTSYQRARAKREHYEALRAQQKYEETAGNLIDKAGTVRSITAILAALTQALDKVPDRAAAELPDEFHHETRLAIRREMDHALQTARRALAKLLPEAAA